jgi:hypothetical protein
MAITSIKSSHEICHFSVIPEAVAKASEEALAAAARANEAEERAKLTEDRRGGRLRGGFLGEFQWISWKKWEFFWKKYGNLRAD